jgi:hypothetical protein
MSIPIESSNQIVGNVGLYYVCYKLSCLGWNVMPTTRNARGIDILIYSQDAKRTFTIQVKALSKCPPVPLGNSTKRLQGDFFIICRNVATENPQCFILTPQEVKRLAHRSMTLNGFSYWLQPKAYAVDEFKSKWDRIGRGASSPLLSDKALPPKLTGSAAT